MRKIIAIGGEPATGKTTLMRAVIQNFTWENKEPWKLVPTMYSESLDLHIVGKYADGDMFAGTDKTSMSVMPEAKKWVSQCTSNILFEGDRLFSGSFLEHCLTIPDVELHILFIQATPENLEFRHKDRGDEQSEVFLKGRKTKYSNILGNFDLSDNIEMFNNNNLSEQGIIIDRVLTLIKS